MRLRLCCPVCETPGRAPDGAAEWRCPACDHLVALAPSDGTTCAACGNHELFRKKDFPHGLGMAVLVGAFATSTITYWLYDKWLTWAILIGSAAFDGLLYLWVRDVIVCYRCHAEHRDAPQPERVAPFELTTHERYRQERIRLEQMQKSGQ
ncbi:MAG: hypothetical protein U0797_21975 [Gemmataceae bacterium]